MNPCNCDGWNQMIKDHESYNCKPYINVDDSFMTGCDAELEIPVKFCPFCGNKLEDK